MRAAPGWEAAGNMHSRLLARARTGPPKRKRPGPAQSGAQTGFRSGSKLIILDGTASAQRAILTAARRAEALNRRAALYHDLGLVDAALRTTALAESIRAVLS